nr:acyl-CoA dehydrogenase family protein [Novosphingobium sp. ERN07]
MIDRHAIYLAFMQVGGASAALRAACDYVGQRYAFGRALGSFQGIKHGLADVYAAVEVARSNAWYAAACLDIGNYKLTLAAAAARVSATEAFRRAARANIHYQGGLGVTQEADAHLYYRRAQALGMTIGNPAVWRERFLQASLALRNAATPLDRAA